MPKVPLPVSQREQFAEASHNSRPRRIGQCENCVSEKFTIGFQEWTQPWMDSGMNSGADLGVVPGSDPGVDQGNRTRCGLRSGPKVRPREKKQM